MDKDQIQVFKDYKDHILEGQFPGIGSLEGQFLGSLEGQFPGIGSLEGQFPGIWSLEGQFPGVDLDFPFEGDFTEPMYGYYLGLIHF